MMYDAGESNEILNEFLVESYEGLDQLDRDLIVLEHRGNDPELLGRVFRCIHTIKGTCGFLGFEKLEAVAHVGENLLSRLRDGSLAVTPAITSALLAMIDAIRALLQRIEQHGDEGDSEHGELVAVLAALADADAVAADADSDSPSAEFDADTLAAEAPDVPLVGTILVARGEVDPADVASAVHEQAQGTAQWVGEILVARGAARPEAVKEALDTQQDIRSANVSDSSIRVDVALLDRLMNLVGELVLARNQILQSPAAKLDAALLGTTQRLNLITSELQEGVMKTRMQPIGSVWSKFPRVVRDLAIACGKQVNIAMEGAETELDKTIIEAIKDPLTHIVRNSVDHGIEGPQQRVTNNKSPEGRLLLRAFHEGGQVNIEIIDDGAGIDPARLRAKAVEKGLHTPESAARLSDRDAMNLIFAAGFSTAAKVTNVSGRGVGMDVVRTNIEKIGGTVDVSSIVGNGTTLRIKIPLTLAIIPGLVVTSAGERFVIPQVSLLELVRLEHEEAKLRVERIGSSPVYRLRGKLLPLVHLNHTLDLPHNGWPAAATAVGEPLNIVVVQTDGTPFGLVVDGINDTEEIVVKPLGKQLKGISAFAGATIMGDGQVALILDVHGIAQRAGVLGEGREAAATGGDAGRAARGEVHTLLLFGFGDNHRMALPLSEIARLEEFAPAMVEHTGPHDVVQYRNQIMPLVRLADSLPGVTGTADPADPLQVIVYANGDQYFGLVVDRILDILEVPVTMQRRRTGGAVLGTAIIQNKVTDILDIRRLVETVELDFASSVSEEQEILSHA